MDAGPPSSSTLSPGPGSSSSRKERGAIAAQVRSRDAMNSGPSVGRVKDSNSNVDTENLNLQNRGYVQFWKDRTLVEILERLKIVENKIDSLTVKGNTSLAQAFGASQATSSYLASTPLLDDPDAQESHPANSGLPASPTVTQHGGYRYDSSVSKMIEWPAIRQLLGDLGQKPQSPLSEHDLSALPEGIRESTTPLPTDGIQSTGMPNTNVLQVPLQLPGSPLSLNLNPPSIDWDTMQRLSKGYFDVFNFLHPIMDRQWFNSNTLTSIINNGFQEGATSTLVLLVFALGEVALTASEVPISAYKGRPSGIKGGTIDRPPGITYFNEARKRMGFALTEISIENCQMLSLASLYYASCGQAIRSKSDELHGARADLIRRAFWHCSIMETYLHMEFGLPMTGLEKMGDAVGLPDFSGPITNDDYIGNQTSYFQEHFASQIVLRQLSTNFHNTLNNSFGVSSSLPFPGFGSFSGISSDNNSATVKQLAAQLDQWRGMLPGHLRWQDDQMMLFTDPSQDGFTAYSSHQDMFQANLDTPPATYPYAADIQVALLRTRYYYNKYLIYRPCLFKAIHHPESLTREDAEGAAECLKASLKWPITLSPPCTNKRLVPMAFFWSQNIFGILILLHLSQQHPMLLRIRSTLCGQRIDVDVTETVNLYLDWLRDMKKIDSTANWCWTVIRLLYCLDD
ncbi:hypothetical protein G7Z17_g9877 [Cylindrodendrum hubeiense]|uniref:Transcription factor domain-containing protein n=1 Tax=Cylindrodendrum hubeiense TaxID=595255 RepID=A0A9P5LCW5_9HYPO|nr:hypothetical protein G7Z17_g9877 [Cylindrodendrum hubeiense]